MLTGWIVASIIFALAMIMLGLFVFLRNPRLNLNRAFILFSGFTAGWLIANSLGGTLSVPIRTALIANKFTLFFALAGTYFLYVFAILLLKKPFKRFFKMLTVLNIAALLLSISPQVIISIVATKNTYGIKFGPASDFYFLMIVVDAVSTLMILVKSRTRLDSFVRAQINTILYSLAAFLVGVVATNALLPLFFNYYGLTNAGALFSLFLIAGMAYTITKHRLFDVHLIVARSIAYVLALSSLAAIFTTSTIIVTNVFISDARSNLALLRAIYATLAVLLAFFFEPIKAYFNRTTNRFFYRDAYDSQIFLNEFNKVLVTTYDLEQLLKTSAKLIENTIKTNYVLFDIAQTTTQPHRILGAGSMPVFKDHEVDYASMLDSKMHGKLIVADELEGDTDLQNMMRKKNIAVIARLTSSTAAEGVGYLYLGSKKSGNLYTAQDLDVTEIIANELVIAVQNALHFQEIQNFNKTLQGKVNEATSKLRTANEKLKALDETKDDFISMASHQLRTPLTSVKGYLSMVMEGDAGKLSEQQKEMLGQAFFSSQRMVYLISDLLNVSRLKTGKFVIDASPVNLATMVQQELAQLQETAKAKELNLTYEKPDKFPSLMLDETKTRQVIMNFCDNAIYYTPAGGHIKVEVIDKPNTVELRVVDDGIGVPRSEQHHLFTKFYRAGNARKARPDGTGLGLFMAKKVVVAQGGSIILESTEGKGSTFGFSFNKDKHEVSDKQQQESDKKKAASSV